MPFISDPSLEDKLNRKPDLSGVSEQLTPDQIQASRLGEPKFEGPLPAGTTPVRKAAFRTFGIEPRSIGEAAKKEEKGPGFLSRLSGILGKRLGEVEKISEITSLGEQSKVEGSLQRLGQSAGFILDIFAETITTGARAVTPDFIEKEIINGFKSAGITIQNTRAGSEAIEAAKQGIEAYNVWKASNLRASRNLESIVNIGSLLTIVRPTPKMFSPIGKPVGTFLGKPVGAVGRAVGSQAMRSIEVARSGFIRGLVRAEQTAKVKKAQVGRTTEQGFGPGKRSTIQPSSLELRAEQAVATVKDINPNKTFQGNYNVIQASNLTEAKKLEAALQKNDIIFPKKELLARLKAVSERLGDNPLIVGDAERTAAKLMVKINQLVETAPAKGSSLLRVRKDFDAWVKEQKGANIYKGERENAFSISNRQIRQEINNFLDEKATSVSVKDSLRRQNGLFTAMEHIEAKAAIEADTAFTRLFQRAEKALIARSRVVQGLALVVGIGIFGASQKFALPFAVATGSGFFIWKTGKLVLNPKIRVALSDLLKEIEKDLPKALSQEERTFYIEARTIISSYLEEN